MMHAPPPWLSILVPIFNVENYLAECVQSIVDQQANDIEVLLLDDASTDGSRALAHAIAARHAGQVRVLEHARNQGLSGARNTLLQHARGDYVWFLDSDDKLLPGSIAELRAVIEQSHPDVIACDFAKWFEQPRKHQWLRRDRHQRTFRGPSSTLLRDASAVLRGAFAAHKMHSWSKVARRGLWLRATPFPVGRYFEDISTTPLLLLQAGSFWHQPSPWVAYRQRQGSILATPDLRKLDHLASAMQLATARADFSGIDRDARFAWSRLATRCFVGACRQAVTQPGGPQRLPAYRQALMAALATPPEALMLDHLRRGWIWRWLRLRHWLARAAAPVGHPPEA